MSPLFRGYDDFITSLFNLYIREIKFNISRDDKNVLK